MCEAASARLKELTLEDNVKANLAVQRQDSNLLKEKVPFKYNSSLFMNLLIVLTCRYVPLQNDVLKLLESKINEEKISYNQISRDCNSAIDTDLQNRAAYKDDLIRNQQYLACFEAKNKW